MKSLSIEDQMTDFFNRYNAAFTSADGEKIASLYNAPTVTMRGDGTIHCLQSSDEIAEFFQGISSSYYAEGSRGGIFKNLNVVPIGGCSALTTLDWELWREDDSLIRGWCQSYNVVYVEDEWKILVSTFHINK